MEEINFDKVSKAGDTIKKVGYVIYALAIIFAEIMFLGLMREVFSGLHPMFTAFAAIGAVTTGLTAVIMPMVKNDFVATKVMGVMAWIFWAMEVVVLALNTSLSFDVATGATDSWVSWWRHISPASPVLVIVIWGVMFQLHPKDKFRQSIMEFWGNFIGKTNERMNQVLDSPEMTTFIREQVEEITAAVIKKQFNIMYDKARMGAESRERTSQISHGTNGYNDAEQSLIEEALDANGASSNKKNFPQR